MRRLDLRIWIGSLLYSDIHPVSISEELCNPIFVNVKAYHGRNDHIANAGTIEVCKEPGGDG